MELRMGSMMNPPVSATLPPITTSSGLKMLISPAMYLPSVYPTSSTISMQREMCIRDSGYTIYGWVLPPHGYQPGKKYPAVLSIHGGPQSAYSSLLYPTMQRYAAEGYFVLFCNPRGSTDYGRVFMDLEGKFGTIDFDDLMAFTDHVVRQYPDIDSHRLGVRCV